VARVKDLTTRKEQVLPLESLLTTLGKPTA
jgi:hypothetical protein